MNNATPPPAFPADFIASVHELLTPAQHDLLAQLSTPREPRRQITLPDFLNRLFARPPREFFATRTPADVARMVRGGIDALSAAMQNPAQIAMHLHQDGGNAALFVALPDCPFIVSSLAEQLSEAQIRVNAFLHPIFGYRSSLLSLSYIDLDPSCAAAAEALIPHLRETLTILRAVVHDFEPMSAATTDAARTLTRSTLTADFGPLEGSEAAALLSWLVDGCFFMLGTAVVDTTSDLAQHEELGLWRVECALSRAVKAEVQEGLRALGRNGFDLSIRKLRHVSPVHRPATLVNILLRSSEQPTKVFSLCGYLTSKAWSREALDVPVLRRKLQKILADDMALPASHDYKYMVEVVDNMPKDDALCASQPELHAYIKLALGVFSREVTRSHSAIDDLKRRALTMVVLPPERYSAQVRAEIQRCIEDALGAQRGSSEVHLDSSKRRQLRLYISTPLPTDHTGVVPSEALNRALALATLGWEERLRDAVTAAEMALPYPPLGVFSQEYQVATTLPEALSDVRMLADVNSAEPLRLALFGTAQIAPKVVLYSLQQLSLSSALPVLENVGLEVLKAHSYTCCTPLGPIYLLKLGVRAYDGSTLDTELFNSSVAPGLEAVLRGTAHNDLLNLLLRKASLSIRQISLLRAYCALLWQVHKLTTKRTMWESLAAAPHIAAAFCRMFETKFNPDLSLSLNDRIRLIEHEEQRVTEALRKVPDISHDRVLKALLSLLRHTVRTNFYAQHETIAVKIHSELVDVMPLPRPLYEIFVFSHRIEGTHLRSSKVARGGIRWSERPDDFRAEVLGLMKTQKIKNVIIVPSGAKGGFVVKSTLKEGENLSAVVEQSYREYIRALLSIADNNLGGTVTHPARCIVYDQPDPYFVVAADKGTATFSDVANSLAQKEFNFWLGDAFASGGSVGYDHKKYGITARGGWECVTRHFRDLGVDYESHSFSVVGIGDMSGDVFGNGLLLSRNMKLVGAFNHKHIFVDPQPDPERSYEERKRLFALPRSQWSDYAPELISAGGGVFNRFDKEILLSAELRAALGIPAAVPATVDGETLITLLLQAPVDLLWNGGIGTYVKGRGESHSDVNDGANDRVRINAEQLRARVVGEGGNLGFTQRARVEFALAGGRINTDAIDNSGGVDLSDHEVNLKLLLAPLVDSGTLSTDHRNLLLKEVDAEVVRAVLDHNRDQALMLSISQIRSKSKAEDYRLLLRLMERLGFVDRRRDSLPDEADLDLRATSKSGLTRPELALCSASVKMWIKGELRNSTLCGDADLTPFLLRYFPPRIQSQHRDAILNHPLKNDIIASEVVNSLLPVVGISYVHSLVALRGATVPAVMKCIVAADRILNTDTMREQLRRLDTTASCSTFTRLWLDLGVALRAAAEWLLQYHGATHSLRDMVKLYSSAFDTLTQHANTVFSGAALSRFESRVQEYQELGVSHDEAVHLSLYRRVLPMLEVLWSAREFGHDVQVVAGVFAQVLDDLGVNTLFQYEDRIEPSNKWERELISGAYHEIRRALSLITGEILGAGIVGTPAVRAALHTAPGYEGIRTTMLDITETARQQRPFQAAVLPVISRQLRTFTIARGARESS